LIVVKFASDTVKRF